MPASPAVSWSESGFKEWLAQAEGLTLAQMHGFGGDSPWSSVPHALATASRSLS